MDRFLAEFIFWVLSDKHLFTMDYPDEKSYDRVKKERVKIANRYTELKSKFSFAESERIATIEWLMSLKEPFEDDEVRQERKSHICFSCGYIDERVEAQGIWYCPNALCMGCGGGWFRQTLESYKETGGENGSHTIDEEEWLKKGREYNTQKNIPRYTFFRTKDEE